MQQAIEVGPIDESKIDPLGLDLRRQLLEVLQFRFRRLADVVRNVPYFQKIKDVRAAIHAARPQGAFLLRKIEERQVFERHVVEVEVAAKTQLRLDEFAQPTAKDAPAGDRPGQPAQRAQRFERRIFRIINEVRPVAVLDRPASGENRRYAGRAVAQHRSEPFAVRCK